MTEKPQTCRLTFLPSRRSIDVLAGTTLFHATKAAGLPLASSCSGDAICARCKVEVCAGEENLEPPTPAELRCLTRLKAPPELRIACEARLRGDVTITTGYW